jgi:hypothetical protein
LIAENGTIASMMNREDGRAPADASTLPISTATDLTGDALPIATQDLLAVLRGVAIASPHADIPTSVAAPAIDIYANPRASVTSVAVSASVDIYANPGAPRALASPDCAFPLVST